MKILNNREARKLLVRIEEHWDCDLSPLLKKNSFALTKKDKLYLVNREVHTLQIGSRVNATGMYFANIRDNNVRLSIEGAEIVSRIAKKNKIIITAKQAYEWIRGRELTVPTDTKGFQIIMHKTDCMGCGYAKEGVLLNYVSKVRRIYAA